VSRPPAPPSPKRLGIVVVLVVSMMLTLFARLYYVQLLDPHKPVQTAHLRHEATIDIPAARGLIVDAYGRPLVANTTQQVITVDRDVLLGRADQGKPMLRRLAKLLHANAGKLAKEITPC
jgi:penicillin-binding protein 2